MRGSLYHQAGIGKWAAKKWKHTRHFCHKHKKELVIVAAIVVAVAAVVYLAPLIALEIAGAATEIAGTLGTAGAAEAAALTNQEEKRKPPAEYTSQKLIKETAIKDVIVENIAESLKENERSEELILLCDADDASSFARFIEAARVGASKITHDVIEETAELLAVITSTMDELARARDQLLPERLASLLTHPSSPLIGDDDDKDDLTYLEVFENGVVKIHESADNLYSTDLASKYTPEVKKKQHEILEKFEIGKTLKGVLPITPSTAVSGIIPKTLASEVCGWSVGQPINNRTWLGQTPKWSTVRERYWKNQAHYAASDPNFSPKYAKTSENIKRMKKNVLLNKLILLQVK